MFRESFVVTAQPACDMHAGTRDGGSDNVTRGVQCCTCSVAKYTKLFQKIWLTDTPQSMLHLLVALSTSATCPNVTAGIMIGSGGHGVAGVSDQDGCCRACLADNDW